MWTIKKKRAKKRLKGPFKSYLKKEKFYSKITNIKKERKNAIR